jgi:hypothetical protein
MVPQRRELSLRASDEFKERHSYRSVGAKSGLRCNVGIRGQENRQVKWCLTDGNLVNHDMQFVVNPLSDRLPMEVSQSGDDLVTQPQLKHRVKFICNITGKKTLQ